MEDVFIHNEYPSQSALYLAFQEYPSQSVRYLAFQEYLSQSVRYLSTEAEFLVDYGIL